MKNKYSKSYLCYLFNRGSSNIVDTLIVAIVLYHYDEKCHQNISQLVIIFISH